MNLYMYATSQTSESEEIVLHKEAQSLLYCRPGGRGNYFSVQDTVHITVGKY